MKGDECSFYVCLIEYADVFNWNEAKLWAMYEKYKNQFYDVHNCDRITWLMNDGTVMETRFHKKHELDCRLKIIISEGTGKYDIKESMKINPKRSVLSL
jgi:hypothetical protein